MANNLWYRLFKKRYVLAKPSACRCITLLVFCFFLFAAISPVYAQTDIQVLALFKNKVMAKVNGKQRLLVAGKPSKEGVLLIKSNSESAQIKADGKVKTYQLGNTIANRYKKRKNPFIDLWADSLNMFTSMGKINGRSVHFLVDTGATTIAMNENDARRLRIDYQNGPRGRAQTASGTVNTWLVTLNSVEVGPILIRNVSAMVIQGTASKQILLGMSFLSRVHMTRSGNKMRLEKKY